MIQQLKEIINGHVNYLKNKFNYSLEPHIVQQAEYRAELCKDCLEATKCPHCGCPTPQAFFSQYKVCPQGKWDAMMDKEDWTNFKIKNTPKKEIEECLSNPSIPIKTSEPSIPN